MTPRTLIALYKIANATPPLSSEQQEDAATVDQDKQPNTSDPQLKAAEQTSKPAAEITGAEVDANQRRQSQQQADWQRAMTHATKWLKDLGNRLRRSKFLRTQVAKSSGGTMEAK